MLDVTTYDWNKRHERRQAEPVEIPPAGTVIPITDAGGAHKYALTALREEAAIVAGTREGSRNDALNKAAFRIGRHVGAGTLPLVLARQTLAAAGRACGLDEREIDLILRDTPDSALNQGQGHPRAPTPMAELPVLTTLEELDDAIAEDPDDTDAFWDARPMLGHLHTFARARSVAPWAVLGNTLARVVAATEPFVALPPIVGGYASLNLFVGIVGRSGTGKGAAEAVAREALDVGIVNVRNTGSGEGIVHAYMKRTKEGTEQHTKSVLFSIPEIDSLGAVSARQGATLMPLLRQGWSGEQLGFTYADPLKNLIVNAHKYRMCLVAGIQPGRAGTLLDDADGGTPQRFSWLTAVDRDAPDYPPDAPEPRHWIAPGSWMSDPNGLAPMGVCASARELITSVRRQGLRGEGEALDGHALLTRLKMAAALALLERRQEVTEEDWQLSGVIATKSDATRARVVAHRQLEVAKSNRARAEGEADRQVIVGDKVTEHAVQRVSRSILRRLSAGEMSHAEARRACASRDRDYFDEALEHLHRAGQIEITEVPGGLSVKRVGADS